MKLPLVNKNNALKEVLSVPYLQGDLTKSSFFLFPGHFVVIWEGITGPVMISFSSIKYIINFEHYYENNDKD